MKSYFPTLALLLSITIGLQAQQPNPSKSNQPSQINIPSVGLVLVRDCSPKLVECLNHFKEVPSLTLLAEREPVSNPTHYEYPTRVVKASMRVMKSKNDK